VSRVLACLLCDRQASVIITVRGHVPACAHAAWLADTLGAAGKTYTITAIILPPRRTRLAGFIRRVLPRSTR
jgi:hypothetical protein